MHQYAPSYVVNAIKINAAQKNLVFNIFYTQKNFEILNLFKILGIIRKFILIKGGQNERWRLKTYILFYKNYSIYKTFKLISSPSHPIFISHKSLSLLHKRTYNSIFIIETDKGLVTHLEALRLKKGGKIWSFISF